MINNKGSRHKSGTCENYCLMKNSDSAHKTSDNTIGFISMNHPTHKETYILSRQKNLLDNPTIQDLYTIFQNNIQLKKNPTVIESIIIPNMDTVPPGDIPSYPTFSIKSVFYHKEKANDDLIVMVFLRHK